VTVLSLQSHGAIVDDAVVHVDMRVDADDDGADGDGASIGDGSDLLAELQGDFDEYIQTYYEQSDTSSDTESMEALRAVRIRMQRLELNVLHARLHGLRIVLAMSQEALRSRAAHLELELDHFSYSSLQARNDIESLLDLLGPSEMQLHYQLQCGIPESVIETLLPKLDFGEACMQLPPERDASELECSICLSDFTRCEHVRLLPCKHLYHVGCIDRWLARASTCPNCKRAVRKGGG